VLSEFEAVVPPFKMCAAAIHREHVVAGVSLTCLQALLSNRIRDRSGRSVSVGLSLRRHEKHRHFSAEYNVHLIP
jgi:hypothetical protein